MKIIPVQIFHSQNVNQDFNFTGRKSPKNFIIPKFQLEAHLQDGKSVKEIAALYEVNEQRIYKLLKIFSLKTPTRTKYPSLAELKPRLDVILPELIKQGKSVKEISEISSASKSIIIKWIKTQFTEGLRTVKKEINLNFLKSKHTDEEIAEMKGIKSASVRSMRSQFKIHKYDPEKETNVQRLREYVQTSNSVSDLSKLMGWKNDKTRRYIKKYQLQETLDNNQKHTILNLVNQGFGKYEAAQKLNMAEPTLKKLLKKFDMETVFEERRLNKINTILELKKQGLTNKQISQKTGIPLRTVSYYTNPQK